MKMNIADNLTNTTLHFPDHCAVIEAGRQVTYRQFDSESSKIAAALSAAGIQLR